MELGPHIFGLIYFKFLSSDHIFAVLGHAAMMAAGVLPLVMHDKPGPGRSFS